MGNAIENGYDLGFVAFLDILGFREHVNKFARASEFLDILDGKVVNISKSGEQKITYTMMSDSIVLSCLYGQKEPVEEKVIKLKELLRVVETIQFQASVRNIWMRGGVASGEISHSEKNVFGPAMVRAYELEQQAVFPRVVLDYRIISEFKGSPTLSTRQGFINQINDCIDGRVKHHYLFQYEASKEPYSSFFRPDVPFFIHYLNSLNSDNQTYTGKIYKIVHKNILEASSVSVYQKYKWVADYIYSFINSAEFCDRFSGL